MRTWTYIENNKFINPPNGVQIIPEWGEFKTYFYATFDIDNLEHVNFIRRTDGKSELKSLHGYCMSTGCSCRHPNGSKAIPHCGLFKAYDSDGIRKDFIYYILGV